MTIRGPRLVPAIALALLTACSDGPGGLGDEPLAEGLVVSDPVTPASLAASARVNPALAGSAADDVAYVSLAPGTVPSGSLAIIRRLGDVGSTFTTVFDGGFDPVPVAAQPGDSIEVRVTDAAAATLFQARRAVATGRAPVVVRSDPPRGKTDVAVNASIVIVFSEPVASGSLTSSSVRLFRGASAVAGTVHLLQGTGATAAFTPTAPLSRNSAYRLIVTQAVRDLEGDALPAPVSVDFTTGQSSTGPAASITVSPDTVFMTGATYQMAATVRDAADNQLIDQPVTWSTDDPTGLTVSSTGLLTGLLPGYYAVRATVSDLFAEAQVYVTAAGPPATLTLSPTQANVGAAGDTIILTATVRDAVGRLLDHPSVSWSSNDASVATVAAGSSTSAGLAFGTVTSGSTGGATITATSGPASATASVTVVPPLPVASLTVTPGAATVIVQGTTQLSATVRDENGKVVAGRPITWTTDNAAVATVNGSGLVTGVSEGSAAVTATSEAFSDTATISVTSNQILFTTARDANWEIYLVNLNGSGLTNLTNSPCCGDFSPAWSPNGAKIAFLSETQFWRIYVMNADGSGLTLLTGDGISLAPAWSPDGTKIAFLNDRGAGYTDIWVMNADGSNPLNLTNTYTLEVSNGNPVWSPDGTKIAFIRRGDVFVMNADGSQATNVTNTNSGGEFLDFDAWSPDGTKILFLSYRDAPNAEIYVMNADGSSALNLTNNPARDDLGSWSPDGTKIIFVSDRDANEEIYVMNVDGSGITRLTNDPTADYCPRWSPDGTKVLFERSSDSSHNGDVEIYVMNADGSGRAHLTTNNPGSAECPTWRPR